MKKSTSRNLYLIGIVIVIIGVVALSIGATNSDTTTGNISPLLYVGGIVEGIGGIIAFIGYIGALVKTAQLGRWGWFVCLLLFSGITMLIYIFAGPTEHA